MKWKLGAPFAILLAVMALVAPAFAHHGTAGEDTSKVVTVKGTVSRFEFINPHVQIYVDVKDDQGKVHTWNGEASNALVLHRSGWNSKIIQIGDQITLNGYQSKKREEFLRLTTIVLPDGRQLEAFPRAE